MRKQSDIVYTSLDFQGEKMRAVIRLAAAFSLFTIACVAHAADLTGVWKGSFDFQGSAVPVTMNLKVDGSTVTGTVEGLPTSPTDIHDGKLAGDALTFWVETDYEGQTYKLIYKGTVAAEKIEFNFGTDDGSFTSGLTVKRDESASPAPAAAAVPAEVSGDWKGTFDFNGTDVPVVFHFKGSGAAVTGTIDGMGQAPIEIHEGKVAGDTLTFWVNVDYEGQSYTLMYNGKVTSASIEFQFGTADSSWGSSVTAARVK